MDKKDFILSIETAVQGGSISLLQGITALDGWVGTREVSKSEDILEEIKNILERTGVQRKEIKRIVVSRGPGSYTGVRIGMAVGIGLRKALDCELIGMSALEAMLLADRRENMDEGEEIITAVPIGRNQICRQNFKSYNRKIIESETPPQLATIEDFFNSDCKSRLQTKKIIILHRKLYLNFREKYEHRLTENNFLIDAGENIAVLNGMKGARREREAGIASPIYVSESLFRKS